MNEVTLSVRSDLQKVIDDLTKIRDKGNEVSNSLKDAGRDVGDALNNQAKETENFFGKLSSMGKRVADQLKGDFKSLVSINALGEAMKISNQFRGSIQETVALSDTIRKLGQNFGVASSDFTKFQANLTKGLGQIGLSSDVAARTMQGLSMSGTRVAGQESVQGYAQQSGQLASVTRQQGQEGEIARLVAQVIQSRGGNVNDMKEVGKVVEDVRRVFNSTGQQATTTLEGMKTIFTGMSKDFRDKITTRGLANLASAATVAGPQSTKFLQEFLSKSPIARKAMEAQGFKGVFGEKGLDIEKFRTASKNVLSRVGGDPRLAAQTLGLSEDAAEGFVRLSESLDKVKAAQDSVEKSTGNIEDQYKSSMTLGESFSANINRVKQVFAAPLAMATQGLTGGLSTLAGTNSGALATVAGGGVLAAMLAGKGLKGIGGAMGVGGIAQGAAIEAATGRQVTPVYVVNAKDISSAMGGGLADAASKGGGLLGKVGGAIKSAALLGSAFEVGGLVGEDINDKLVSKTEGTTEEGFQGNAVERLFFKLDMLLDKFGAGTGTTKQVVELNTRDLKVSKQPSRGASQ